MKNNISIIRYSKEEIPLLKDLWVQLNDYHIPIVKTFRERFVNVSFERHLEELNKYKNVFAYVAIANDTKVGFIMAFANNDFAELDSIYVIKEFRQCGIGDALVKCALKELIGKYKEIVYRVAEGNEQAFHNSNHFKKRYSLYQYDYNEK